MEKTYRIKPLVWDESHESQTTSETVLGEYLIDCYFTISLTFYSCNDTHCNLGTFSSNEEAKAAAQEHYESRLKQCLEEIECKS